MDPSHALCAFAPGMLGDDAWRYAHIGNDHTGRGRPERLRNDKLRQWKRVDSMASEERAPFTQWQGEELRTDEACRAADLASILNDLDLVARWCTLYEVDGFDDDIRAALWEATVVAYGRSFTAGRDSLGRAGRRRQITEEELAILTDGELDLHRAVKAERNRHIGHRDDRHGETNQVFKLTGEADAAGITGVGLTTWRRRGPATYEVAAVRQLAERLSAHFAPIYTRELQALNSRQSRQ